VSLETAIIIATALIMTLPIGWWVSRSSRNQGEDVREPRKLTRDEREDLVKELRVVVMRGVGRGTESERVLLNATMRELRREGLAPSDIDKLSEVGIHNLWVCQRLVSGSDAEASAVIASLPAEVRDSWVKIRAKIRRERQTEERREAESHWIRTHAEDYDRLTLVASGGPAIAQWLATQGPTVWHAVALGLSPDRVGYGPWLWLSDQRSLDRATAIGMFLKSEPQNALTWRDDDVTGPRRDQLALLKQLARRLADDGFTQRSFAIAASNRAAYFKVQDKVLAERGELPWPTLPRHALGPEEGAEARTPYWVDGTKVRKRVDLAPYVSGQRRA